MDMKLILIIGCAVIFFVVVGLIVVFWYYRRRGGNQFPFLLYSAKGNNVSIIDAKILADPENKSDKKFVFPGTDNTLPIREPTWWMGGKAYRQITHNKHGEFVYLEAHELDDGKHRKLALLVEERQIALSRIKENNSRYQTPMKKLEAYVLLGGFVLVMMLLVGIIYCTIAYATISKDMVKLAKENVEVASSNKAVSRTNAKVTEQLALIVAAITDNANITRQIT